MKINNWYVITGPSCSGKTTLIDSLGEKGYSVFYETARILIDQELKKGLTITKVRQDEIAFQNKVLHMKVEREKKIDRQKIVFFDRGIPDTSAYYRLYNTPASTLLKKALKNCYYRKVFFLEQLSYTSDAIRTETAQQQRKLSKMLKDSYRQLNFDILTVPILPIGKRVDFILDNL